MSKRAADRGANRTFWRLQGETEPLHSLITGRSKAGQSEAGLAGKQQTHTPTSPPTQINTVFFLLRGIFAAVGTWILSLTGQPCKGSTAPLLHTKPHVLREFLKSFKKIKVAPRHGLNPATFILIFPFLVASPQSIFCIYYMTPEKNLKVGNTFFSAESISIIMQHLAARVTRCFWQHQHCCSQNNTIWLN